MVPIHEDHGGCDRDIAVKPRQVAMYVARHATDHKLAEIGTSGRYGLYHTCNGGRASWFDFAAAVFELAGMDVDLRPVKSDEMKRPATRPASSVLRSMSLELSGMAPMRDWRAALADYFNE